MRLVALWEMIKAKTFTGGWRSKSESSPNYHKHKAVRKQSKAMGKSNVYSVNQGTGPTYFEVKKFDEDLNLEGTYHVSEIAPDLYVCGCPAGGRTSCRHRDMVRLFRQQHLVGAGWTYHYDKGKWTAPPFQDEVPSDE